MKYSIDAIDLNTLKWQRVATATNKVSAYSMLKIMRNLARHCAPDLEFYLVPIRKIEMK